MEHVVPSSKGGTDSWMNLVSACKACNRRKANRTPDAAGMKLHYVPYIPNRYEAFILRNRKILADQMEFLLLGVPRNSRVHLGA
jgi:5-methylcytosine-specific restriction endonuclease McrA